MTASAITTRPGMSDEEWRVRCDLAALYRAFVKYGWTDLIYTHISARHPDLADTYLINPYGLMFDEITASSLLVVDFEGKVISGDHPYNDAGHAIHSAVLKARPDTNWVLHTHTRAGMAVSCMECGLLPLTQQAMYIMKRLAYHPWNIQQAAEECEALGRDLGRHNAMILHNHGLLTCGKTPGEAFSELYNLETACKVQVDVLASGQKLVLPDDDTLAVSAAKVETFSGELEWGAIVRWLERHDPSYRT